MNKSSHYVLSVDLKTGNLSKEDAQYLADKYPDFRPIEFVGEAGEWGYEVDAAYAFKNENGSYAVITESHCSCYDIQDDGGGLEGVYKTKEEMLEHLDKSDDSTKKSLRASILSISPDDGEGLKGK